MCQEWRSNSDAFVAHIGPKPSPRHSLDRINNDGNYEPGNVRWATWSQQNSNKRPGYSVGPTNRRPFRAFGRRFTYQEISRLTGLISASDISKKIRASKSFSELIA